MDGTKKVPATFLFPAKVLNGTSLKFGKPRLDSTFTVAGIYCRVLCDDVTAQGVQNFLQSSTVLNKDQVVRGKRFEFGSIAIPGSLESQHFTRFNRSFFPTSATPGTPSRGNRSQPFSTPTRSQQTGLHTQNTPSRSETPFRNTVPVEPPRPFNFDRGNDVPNIPLYDCTDSAFDLRGLSNPIIPDGHLYPGDLVLVSACIQIHKSLGCLDVEYSFPPNYVVLFEHGDESEDLLVFPAKAPVVIK
ncbi:hypothetical protein HDU77_000994, partial [Chytriomyces hyalinus]